MVSDRSVIHRYCDREFEDEKILIVHQKAKHFKCLYCSRRLNSASGLVVHIAQIHKKTIDSVPNALPAHSSPELEIFGVQGIPPEDMQRHYDGLPIAEFKKSVLGEAGLVSLLAAQKAATSGNPLPMSAHVPLKSVQILDGIGPANAIPKLTQVVEPMNMSPYMSTHHMFSQPSQHIPAQPLQHVAAQQLPQSINIPHSSIPSNSLHPAYIEYSFQPVKVDAHVDALSGKFLPNMYLMVADAYSSPVPFVTYMRVRKRKEPCCPNISP